MARKQTKKPEPLKSPDGPLSKKHDATRSLTLTAGIFIVHGLGLISLFIPLSGLFDNRPIIEQDWGLHFHHLASLATFWRQDRMLWGYNPFFMAGYPSNTIQDLSVKLFELVAVGLSSIVLSPLQWFKISALAAMASAPWLMYFSARNFFAAEDSKHVVAAAATLLGTIYWWNSLPREMFFYGMIGFPAAAYLSIWGVSLFYRLFTLPQTSGWLRLGCLLFAAVILPLHVQAVLVFLPPILALLVTSPRSSNEKPIRWAAAAVVISFAANVFWLIPAFNHRTDDVSAAIVEQLPLFASTNPFTFILDYLGSSGFWTFRAAFFEKGYRLALVIVGVVGVSRLIQGKDRSVGIILASAVTGLFIVTYFGGLAPTVRSWQPLRFKVPMDLFLAIGAAYAVGQWLQSRRSARSALVPVLLIGGGITFLVNLIQTESTGKLRLRAGLNPQLTAIVDWIARETPDNARVLFEESGDETGFVYDGTYLSSLVPHRTGRQLIGGPINLYNDRHHFAEFHSGKLFQKDVRRLADDELRNYLQLYNIGAVVAFHPASIRRLQSIPGLVTIEQRIGPVHLMKVHQPLTWFVAGEGAVKAGFNRLDLANLRGDEVILKHHWIEGMTASPSVKIEPIKIADDPIPFIKLINPPRDVVLRAGGPTD